jgi:DNA-binding CsgD family transcriptional regulator
LRSLPTGGKQIGPAASSRAIYDRNVMSQRSEAESIPQGRFRVRVGRGRHNDVVLSDPSVDRFHAEVHWQGPGDAVLADLGSLSGTWVDEQRVTTRAVSLPSLARFGDVETILADANDRSDAAVQVVPTGRGSHQAPTTEVASRVVLTSRERDVLKCISGGMSDKEASAALMVSISTVRAHLGNIATKSGSRRRADLTRLAYELQIL